MINSSKKTPVAANRGGHSERRNEVSSCHKVSLQSKLITKGKKWLHSREPRQVHPNWATKVNPASSTHITRCGWALGTAQLHFCGAPASNSPTWVAAPENTDTPRSNDFSKLIGLWFSRSRKSRKDWGAVLDVERHGMRDWGLMPLFCEMSLGWQENCMGSPGKGIEKCFIKICKL